MMATGNEILMQKLVARKQKPKHKIAEPFTRVKYNFKTN